MSLWRCKGEQNKKIDNFIFHVGFPALKCFKNTCFTLDLEVGTFLYDMVPVSATYVLQFPSTSINPEKCQKTTIYVREGSQLCTRPVLRYERHTIRQANLFSIEWRLPHVAATVRRRAIGPGSERRWPVFCRQMVFDYYIYEDAILNCPCLLGCPINIRIFPMNKIPLRMLAQVSKFLSALVQKA